MSKLLKFPDLRREQEQLALWISRIDRGLTADETRQLQAWLAETHRHRDAFFAAAKLWDRAGVLAELAELFPLQESAAEKRHWRFTPVAVAMLVLLGVAGIIFQFFRHGVPGAGISAQPRVAQAVPSVASYATAIGEQRTIELPDRSVIKMNTNTALQVQYNSGARLLKMLRGEAIFEVAKDPNRVFTVRVGGFDFNAVGTAFDIRAEPSKDLRLLVTEGRVRVRRTAAAVQSDSGTVSSAATPGGATDIVVDVNHAIQIGQSSEKIDAIQADAVAAATAWQSGMIVFDATPLADAVAELGRYSTDRLVFADPALGRIAVSGYFRLSDKEGFLTELQNNLGIKVSRKKGNLIVLSAAGQK